MDLGPAEPFEYGADDIEISKKEYLRYLGIGGEGGEQLDGLIEECLREVRGALRIKGVLRTCPVTLLPPTVDFGFCAVMSASLSKNLSGCRRAAIFAVTAGAAVDRLISKYSALYPSKALVADAIASAAAEGAANRINREITERYGPTRPRFSPGFGDLPLSFQRSVVSFLDCGRKAGITLTESVMLVPTKSTTAIVGIKEV